MKWKKILLAATVFLLSALMFGHEKKAFAQDKAHLELLKKITYDFNAIGEKIQTTIFLDDNYSLYFDFDNNTGFDISFIVSAFDGTQLYKKSFSPSAGGDTFITQELPAGTYTITIIADDEWSIVSASVYAINEFFSYPEFSISDYFVKLRKGTSKKLKIICKPYGINYTVKWKSSNPAVASVSQNGTVKAKKKGTTEISADISTIFDKEHQTLYWKVTVNGPTPSFSKLAKKMKGFHQKNTFFDIIKKNKKAVLEGISNVTGSKNHIKKYGYGYVTLFYPYMELTKKNGKTSVHLKFRSRISLISVNRYTSLGIDSLAFKSSNSSVTFDYSHNKKKKTIDDGVAVTESIAYATLSSDKTENLAKLNKLIKMLNKKKVTLKAYNSSENEYVKYTLSSNTKNNWKKLFRNYKKLLEMY